jgi:hypothetical protein
MVRLGSLMLIFVLACKGGAHDYDDRDRGPATPHPPPSSSAPKPEAKDVPKTPAGAKLTWSKSADDIKLAIDNTPITGEVVVIGVDAKVTFDHVPEGTKLQVGSGEMKAAKYDLPTLPIDFGSLIASLPPRRALAGETKIDTKTDVRVTFPDGVQVTGTVPPLSTSSALAGIETALKHNKPVLFGHEAYEPPKRHTTLYLAGAGAELDDEIVGGAKTMHDIDLVATRAFRPPRAANKKCRGYAEVGGGGPRVDLDLFLIDWEIRVYERRTGKLLETKTIAASSACPSELMAKDGRGEAQPSDSAVAAWLRSRT